MGHRANFVVIENGIARAYYDKWDGWGAAFGIAEGPGPAVKDLKEFEPTNELLDWAFAEGGYLLDFDQNLVIVFGELDDMSEDDGDATEPYSVKYAKYFEEIAHHWHGWRLRYDDRGVDAFAEHLKLRAITSIKVQAASHPEGAEQFEFQAYDKRNRTGKFTW